LSIWKYKHDRGGDTSALSVSVTVDGRHGVIGLNGIAPASGFPDAAINSTGDLKAFDGTTYSDFISGAARPGIDPDPDTYRLTVRKGGLPISSVTFQPILSSPTATELDINALMKIGKATAATPDQLVALGTGLAALDTKSARADADHAAALQALADSAQAVQQAISDLGGLSALVLTNGRIRVVAYTPAGLTPSSRTLTFGTQSFTFPTTLITGAGL